MFSKLLSYDSSSWEKFSLLMQPHFIFTIFPLSKYNLGFFQVKLFFIIHVVIPGHMYVGVYIHVKIYTGFPHYQKVEHSYEAFGKPKWE